MIQITKDKLQISIKTKSAPEDCLNIIHELIGLLQSENTLQEQGDAPDTSRFYILELLREMMPTWEQLKELEE